MKIDTKKCVLVNGGDSSTPPILIHKNKYILPDEETDGETGSETEDETDEHQTPQGRMTVYDLSALLVQMTISARGKDKKMEKGCLVEESDLDDVSKNLFVHKKDKQDSKNGLKSDGMKKAPINSSTLDKGKKEGTIKETSDDEQLGSFYKTEINYRTCKKSPVRRSARNH